jgi:hypothetical protein
MAMRRQSDVQLPSELVQFAYEEHIKQAGTILIRHYQEEENLPGIDHLTPFQEAVMEVATPGVMRRLHNRLQRIEHERNAAARSQRKLVAYPSYSAHNTDI